MSPTKFEGTALFGDVYRMIGISRYRVLPRILSSLEPPLMVTCHVWAGLEAWAWLSACRPIAKGFSGAFDSTRTSVCVPRHGAGDRRGFAQSLWWSPLD